MNAVINSFWNTEEAIIDAEDRANEILELIDFWTLIAMSSWGYTRELAYEQIDNYEREYADILFSLQIAEYLFEQF